MKTVLVLLAALTAPLETPEPPSVPAERFTVYVEAHPRIMIAPEESADKVLEEVRRGVKKRKKWLFLTDAAAKAEVFVTVMSHRVREEHLTVLRTRVRDRARREEREDIQAIDFIDLNELSVSHYLKASVSVRGFTRILAGHDPRNSAASLGRASADLGRQIEDFLKEKYDELAERRRRFASADLARMLKEEATRAPAPPSAPIVDPRFEAYRSALASYRRGDYVASASVISWLTAEELYRASTMLLADEQTSEEWKAAALVHTESIVSLAERGSTPLERARRTGLHLETAKRYIEAISDPEDRNSFQKRWFLLTAYFFHIRFQFRDSIRLLALGLERSPGDTEILHTLGVVHEGWGALTGAVDRLRDAEWIYRLLETAETPPVDLDTRLAHVLVKLGRPMEAEERLRTAGVEARASEAELASWMIRGEIARHEKDWPQARTDFATASEIDSGCQACAVALAAAYQRSGYPAAASETATRYLNAPAPAGDDGWWLYLLGPSSGFEGLLDELRAEVTMP